MNSNVSLQHFCFTSAVCLILSGCVGGFEPTSLLNEIQTTATCIVKDSQITNPPCIAEDTGKYIYANPFGGRSATIQNQTLTATSVIENQNTIFKSTIPSGWSDGTATLQLSLPSTTLVPNNIRKDVTILGVTGTFDVPQPPACSLTNGGGLQSANCLLPKDHYAYPTSFNGRSLNCSVDSEANEASPCWINTPGNETHYLVPYASLPAACASTEGLKSTSCRAKKNQYYYTSNYGGRGTDCSSTTGNLVGPCWLNITTPTEVTFNGSASTASCVDNNKNSAVCMTNGKRWVYTTAYGGRTADCVNSNNTGNCFMNVSTKSSLDGDMIAANIKAGVDIFGQVGAFGGDNMWSSSASRMAGVTPLSLYQESSSLAGTAFPYGYFEIPKIRLSDDGYYSSSDLSAITVYPVDRTNWGSITCGLTGSLNTRAADCATKLGANAVWDGQIKGHAGQAVWTLITRRGPRLNGDRLGQEVWRDSATGMLWSSLVSLSTNWCKASASNNSASVQVPSRFKEDDPSDICDQSSFQETTNDAVSACFEGTGFNNTDSSINTTGKGGLSLSLADGQGRVNWRLPTFYDYEIAEYHGIRFVLPDMGVHKGTNEYLPEWTATVTSASAAEAWTFNSETGAHSSVGRQESAGVRCIGR